MQQKDKTIIYIVRHGEAEGNIYNRSHGVFDTPLTPKGRNQVLCLKERFKDIEFDRIYSSCLMRAKQTASALASDKGLEVLEERDLHEADLGIFEDTSWYEMKVRFPLLVKDWVGNNEYHIEKGESYNEAGLRMYKTIVKLGKENVGKVIVLVSHATAIRKFQEILNPGIKGFSENTAVSKYEFDPTTEEFNCLFYNDYSHLPGVVDSIYSKSDFDLSSLDAYSLEYIPTFIPGSVLDKGTITAYFLKNEVGNITYHIENENLYCDDIFIKEECRSKGYASQCLGEIMYRGRYFKAKKIVVKKELVDNNPLALALYNKNDLIKDSDGNYYKSIERTVNR